MSFFSKISNIPKRVNDDLTIIKSVENWRHYLAAKFGRRVAEEIRLRNGVVLKAPPQTDLNFLFQEIWIDKIYNQSGYEISPDDIIIDIGANIGVFALYAATAAPRTKVYAFEPFPENLSYLRQNISESSVDNIFVEEKAVARSARSRNLEITESGITHMLSDKKDIDSVLVNCTTLNEVLEKIQKCDLLKIDCEGSEYEIIYSCDPNLFNKVRRIVGEYHYRDDSERNGKSLKTFLEKQSFIIDQFIPFNKEVGLICATRKD